MNQKALKTLEFDKIIHILTAHAASEGAKEMCRKLVPYDNINDVEKYKGCGLFVTKENRVKCKKDEYFIADLIGLRAIDEEGEAFGTISDVIQTGANDVYVVTTKQGEEVMIPAIKDCILEVSVEEQDGQAGYVRIHLLPGLLDLNNNHK